MAASRPAPGSGIWRRAAAPIASIASFAAALIAPAAARQPDPPAPPPTPAPITYTFHWGVGMNGWQAIRQGYDWSQMIDFHGAPIRRDTRVLSGHVMSDLYLHGMHLVDAQPNWRTRHAEDFREKVELFLPPDFDGIAILDYESNEPSWERLHPNTREVWEQHLRDARPHVLAGLAGDALQERLQETYDEAVQDFYLISLNQGKALRPNATWGFYNNPICRMHGQFGYGNHDREFSVQNDHLAWLYEAVDAVFPMVYQMARALPDGEPADWQEATVSIATNRAYVLENVAEAVRVARGKPVYAFIYPRYLWPSLPEMMNEFINPINLKHTLEMPLLGGADGVIIWDYIEDEAYYHRLQEFTTDHLAPEIRRVVGTHALRADADPAQAGRAWKVFYDKSAVGQRADGRLTAVGGSAPAPVRGEGEGNVSGYVPSRPAAPGSDGAPPVRSAPPSVRISGPVPRQVLPARPVDGGRRDTTVRSGNRRLRGGTPPGRAPSPPPAETGAEEPVIIAVPRLRLLGPTIDQDAVRAALLRARAPRGGSK